MTLLVVILLMVPMSLLAIYCLWTVGAEILKEQRKIHRSKRR